MPPPDLAADQGQAQHGEHQPTHGEANNFIVLASEPTLNCGYTSPVAGIAARSDAAGWQGSTVLRNPGSPTISGLADRGIRYVYLGHPRRNHTHDRYRDHQPTYGRVAGVYGTP